MVHPSTCSAGPAAVLARVVEPARLLATEMATVTAVATVAAPTAAMAMATVAAAGARGC